MRRSHRAGEGFWSLHPPAVWPDWTARPKRATRSTNPRGWRRPGLIIAASALAVVAADGAFGVTLAEMYLD